MCLFYRSFGILRRTSRKSKNLTKKVYIDKCRFYVSGENLLTWTNYSGIDPEFSSSILDTGVDVFIYPFTRSYVVGLQVTF